MSRAAPVLNLMVVSFPLRLLVGLAVLGATVAVVPGVVARMFAPALEWAVRISAAFR